MDSQREIVRKGWQMAKHLDTEKMGSRRGFQMEQHWEIAMRGLCSGKTKAVVSLVRSLKKKYCNSRIKIEPEREGFARYAFCVKNFRP